MTKLSKAQKWLLFYYSLGFIALGIVSDAVCYLLGKNGVVAESMVESLQRGSSDVLLVCLMVVLFKISHQAEKRS